MRVCVIGAGVAGLCSIKRALEHDCDVVAFEQSADIGGTWVLYEDTVGVHSSMYKGLRTDIPKEVMSYPDYPYPPSDASYIPSTEVLKYLHAYASEFRLRERIKFEHSVVRVRPLLACGWEVTVRDLKNDAYAIHAFDAVLVCTGNFHTPHWAQEWRTFEGVQLHSHDYRDAERFRNELVCIIGSGPSGIDLVQAIASTARGVIWSTRLGQQQLNLTLPDNVSMRGDIAELCPRGAIFADGSHGEFSILLHCTGYSHSFPFLSVDCGVAVEENFVSPLYKHCLSINHPSMAFVGLPTVCCNNQVFDLQARFCLAFITQRVALPPREELLREHRRETEEQWKRGLSKRRAHLLGFDVQERYFESLATLAQLEPVKPVVLKIFNKGIENLFSNLDTYRERKFKVVSDTAFEEI